MGKNEMTKVLIVDDEEAIRFVFKKFLTDAGYEVSLAAHETDAREILSAHNFDVAVIDRILSDGKSGMDLMKEIKKSQPSCELIMISGFPTFNESSDLVEGNSFVYLTKPVKKDEIIKAVGEATQKSRQSR